MAKTDGDIAVQLPEGSGELRIAVNAGARHTYRPDDKGVITLPADSDAAQLVRLHGSAAVLMEGAKIV